MRHPISFYGRAQRRAEANAKAAAANEQYQRQQAKRQAAVEYPDHCPEFWAIELPELDAEFVHPVRIGHV